MIDIQYSAEVRAAKDAGQPIVALESTIITHGMPYPQNIEVAAQVQQDVRDSGAVPATMAVIKGKLHVGLEDDQLKALGNGPSRLDAIHSGAGTTGCPCPRVRSDG